MAHTWTSNLFKPLNLATIVGYPNTMPKEIHKWLPKFVGNNVITPEDHLYAIGVELLNAGIEHEDVAMRLLAMSLTEDAQRWFRGLPDNHLASYDDFAKLLKSRWSTKKDSRMLLAQFNQIKKKENETVKEFDIRFDKLYDHISTDLRPPTTIVRVLYMNAFEGQFAFLLKDKAPDTLAKAKEYSTQIEENLLSSRIDPFQFPQAKVEAKTKTSTNVAPDPITLLFINLIR
jgi:hypothetical protein